MDLTIDNQKVYAYTGTRAFNPDLDTLVFIHGAGADHSIWILQSRYFAYHNRNILALDLPGHGRSTGKPLASIGDLADWLNQVLEHAGIANAALVGHSMGSLVALETAARYPDHVTSLALLGTAVPMPVSESLLNAAEVNDHAAIDMITVWAHSMTTHIGGNRAPGLWVAGGAMRLLEKAAPDVLYTDLKACNDYQDGLDSAARLRCPVLFVLGQRDLMTPPRAAKKLIASVSKTQTVLIENSGHMMFAEKPDETLDALIAFFP
jgi:pimeloyl-ACP methyl ester carboxylesterase